jgi:vacuolar-type H+-ATPase subunit E/Vma4
MRIEEKIAVFAESVEKEAERIRKNALAETKAESEKSLKDQLEKARQKMKEELKETRARLLREQNKQLVEAVTAERKNLAEARVDLVEKLFANILNKLNKYAESEEYKQKTLSELTAEAKKYHALDAYLTLRDCEYLRARDIPPNIALKAGEPRMIGGFILICPYEGVKIDRSFITILEESKSGFSLLKIF